MALNLFDELAALGLVNEIMNSVVDFDQAPVEAEPHAHPLPRYVLQ